MFNCLICMENMPKKYIFHPNNKSTNKSTSSCSHQFCIDCISNHVDAKVQQNILTIECPDVDCKKSIDFDGSIGIIPKAILDRWEEMLSKAKILSMTSLYCPFKECSAPLVAADQMVVPNANCPHCLKDFCTKCKVAWHDGMDCVKFQKSKAQANEDLTLNLVKKKLWMKCPRCKFYVEKTHGCQHIVCRCRCQFCYGCGSEYNKCPGKCGK